MYEEYIDGRYCFRQLPGKPEDTGRTFQAKHFTQQWHEKKEILDGFAESIYEGARNPPSAN